ncbi:MAG: triacylglycerol lipase [Lachnospiraceae bacterium]|nr:triacylglycerol lipase [Lachnospiraceae bacterium]
MKWIYRIFSVAIVTVTALLPFIHGFLTGRYMGSVPEGYEWYGGYMIFIVIILFVLINIIPSLYNRKPVTKRHRILADGAELLTVFMISLTLTIVLAIRIFITFGRLSGGDEKGKYVVSGALVVLCAVLVLSVVFWNGIIRVYLTSLQLGIRYRVWGIILGWVFPANLVMLGIIVHTAAAEARTENDRILLNRSRADEQICKTRYPLLMVHGVFFRDFKQGFLNYWGRIPDDLKLNGATVYYGSQQSAASVAECGAEIADRIRQIVRETGCEKVNIIAHSKGGLDSRYAVSKCGVSDMVASITTINTPHRGCEFADYLLDKIPASVQKSVAVTYNSALRKLGDHDPDFLKAVNDLTHSACIARNEDLPDAPGIYYQSFGSHMKKAGGGRFPLNYSFRLVNYFDGPNDGLVGEKSFSWGAKYEYLEPTGKRGISHGDMIDLNRENIKGFDVREFYVRLVNDLKTEGL